MKKKDLKELLKQEIESEASALERRANTKKSLTSLEMPEDSYEQLMERIKQNKKLEGETAAEMNPVIIPFRQKKALAALAMVAVLVTVTGLGVNGARLYLLKVERHQEIGAFDIITDTDDIRYLELTEKEAYEKIEEELGIIALRLTDRPKGMELEKVYIDSKMGEAVMEFHYGDYIFSIYENKQNTNVSFNAQQDGIIIATIEAFHLGKTINISEVDKGNGELSYAAQLVYGNAFYYLSGDMGLEEMESILYGIIFKNI